MAFLARDALPLPPDENLGPALLGSMWAEFALALIVLSGRFYVRSRIIRKITWDDWFMLLGFTLAFADTVITTISVNYGTGRHEAYLLPDDSVNAAKYNVIGQPIGILSKTCGRIAWAITLYALLPPQHKISRNILRFLIGLQVVANSSITIYIYAQCQPIAKVWDPKLPGTCPPPTIQEDFGTTEASLDTATDFVLAIFPAVIIWTLNMKRSVKISLSLTMGLGLFGMVASIVKTVYLRTLSDPDFSYQTTYLLIWLSLEQYIVIIAGSAPTLRPLFVRRDTASQTLESRTSRVDTRSKPTRNSVWDRGVKSLHPDSDRIELTGAPSAVHYERNSDNGRGAEIEHANLDEESWGGIRKTVQMEVKY